MLIRPKMDSGDGKEIGEIKGIETGRHYHHYQKADYITRQLLKTNMQTVTFLIF